MAGRFIIAVNLCIITALLTGGLVSATGNKALQAGEWAIVRVYYPDDATRIKVFLAFEPQMLETNYEEGYHIMQVTQEEIDRLVALGLRVEKDDSWVAPPVLSSLEAGIESIPGYPCYRTVEETFASAQALADAHPNLATWIDVGDSWEKSDLQPDGYDMMVLKLTNTAVTSDKPKLFVTAAIHAREYATAELVTRFGEYLVDEYGVDADATWILDHHEVHLMLQTNPDGRKEAEAGASWRKNTNEDYCWYASGRGADLNRNFDFQWDCCGGSSDRECDQTYHGASPASEPEIQAVQAHMASLFPDQREDDLSDPAPLDATGIYIDMHSYGKLVLWPWGFTSGDSPNATGLQTLGRKWAYFNDHTPQQANDLYITDGASKDYSYGVFGVPGYTWEVGTAFFQSCSYFEDTLLPTNLPALIYAAKVVRTPYMTPAGPDAINLVVDSSSVAPGTPLTLEATVDDTRYNNSKGTEPTQNIAAAEYYVDVPPWLGGTAYPLEASDGSFDAKSESVTATVDTTGWSAVRHILFVRGQDAAGNWGAFSAIFVTALPTSVDLLSYEATGAEKSITLNWETASETDNLGFNLFRAKQVDGPKAQINTELIPSLVPPGSPIGARYEYIDAEVTEGIVYFYWLEMVDVYGGKEQFGPVSARVGVAQDYRAFLPVVMRLQKRGTAWRPTTRLWMLQ